MDSWPSARGAQHLSGENRAGESLRLMSRDCPVAKIVALTKVKARQILTRLLFLE